MVKKLYTLILILSISASAFAQCVPDVTWTHPGIRPDSSTNLPHGCVGQSYNAVMDVWVPDTIHQAIPPSTVQLPIDIDSITIVSLTGLPPGFSYTTTPSGGKFKDNTHGCLQITGPALASTNTYNLTVILRSRIGIYLPPLATQFFIRMDTVKYYKIVIDPASQCGTGIKPSTKSEYTEMSIVGTKPSPINDYLELNINNNKPGKANIVIFNLVGKKVHETVEELRYGNNNIRLNNLELPNGVYLLTIKNGPQNVTKRIVVDRR